MITVYNKILQNVNRYAKGLIYIGNTITLCCKPKHLPDVESTEDSRSILFMFIILIQRIDVR